MELYLSDKRDELEKEKKKRDAVRSLMPQCFEGVEDGAAYYLADDEWKRYERLSDGVFVQTSNEKNKKERMPITPKSGKELPFDPWDSAKYADTPEYKELFGEISKRKFESLIPIVLSAEGGYSNRKNDRGGETNFGITRPFYEDYKHCAPGIAENIKDITKEDAIKLYKGHWDRYRVGDIHDKRKALLYFDYIVNSNPKNVTQRVQDSLNVRNYNLSVDGVMGPKTVSAINDVSCDDFVNFIQADRANYLELLADGNPSQREFVNGWMNRVNNLSDIVGYKIKYKSKY